MKSKIIMLVISFALIICCVSCARVKSGETAGSDEDILTASGTQTNKTPVENLSEATNSKELTESNILVEEETQNTLSNESDIDKAEPTEEISQPISIMPDESYIGKWSTDKKDVYIFIYGISPTSIQFAVIFDNVFNDMGFAFEATAIEKNGEIAFGDGISTEYRGPSMLNGRLVFENNSVTLLYDNLGEVPDYLKERESNCTFTIKEYIDDWSIRDFKAGHPEGIDSYIVKENFKKETVK